MKGTAFIVEKIHLDFHKKEFYADKTISGPKNGLIIVTIFVILD